MRVWILWSNEILSLEISFGSFISISWVKRIHEKNIFKIQKFPKFLFTFHTYVNVFVTLWIKFFQKNKLYQYNLFHLFSFIFNVFLSKASRWFLKILFLILLISIYQFSFPSLIDMNKVVYRWYWVNDIMYFINYLINAAHFAN